MTPKKLAVVTCLATFSLALPAQAGMSVPSEVTMKQSQANEAKFKGRVSSSASDCVVGRKVVVFRKEQGKDQKLEKTFATESGKWRVKVPMQAGNKLYALVDFVVTPLDTECDADKSPTVNA